MTNRHPAILDLLNALIASNEVSNDEHDCTAAKVSSLIVTLLYEIELTDDDEGEKLIDWTQEIASLRCKVIGGHEWIHDQCCYWGHQYCIGCHAPKYPELAKMTCSKAIAKLGRINESDYVPDPEIKESKNNEQAQEHAEEKFPQPVRANDGIDDPVPADASPKLETSENDIGPADGDPES